MTGIDISEHWVDARARLHSGDVEGAHAAVRRLLAGRPDDPAVLQLAGAIALESKDLIAAERLFRRAVDLAPQDAEARNNLGVTLQRMGRRDEAAESYRTALAIDNSNPDVALNLGALFAAGWKPAEALEWLEHAVRLAPGQDAAIDALGSVLRDLGRVAEAAACFDRAIALRPAGIGYRLHRALAGLPIYFETEEEIAQARIGYDRNLTRLEWCMEAASAGSLVEAMTSVGSITPFYLAYQGEDDLEFQRRHGEVACTLVRAAYPEYGRRPRLRPPGPRLRVGIVSAWLYPTHSNWKMPIQGWVRHLDRTRFDLRVYYIGATLVAGVAEVQAAIPDAFVACTGDGFEEIAQRLRNDDLDVLIYPEIGMSSMTLALAAARLAPIQCSSWGHPDTSGLPTIDYFLSSALMESADADRYYSETLIRLPNLSIAYSLPEIEQLDLRRGDFGLAEEAVCYFCAQSVQKYLPQHDGILVEIARRVPQAQFVFIARWTGADVSIRMGRRLAGAFRAAGLDPAGRIVVTSRHLSTAEFNALARNCDVFLDSLAWSGCNSVMEAMQNGLPTATLPGRFMRGRHTYAFLRMMGLDELIADSESEYIDLMARLGNDNVFRADVSRRIGERLPLLLEDMTAVRGLEDFLDSAVTARRREQDVESHADAEPTPPALGRAAWLASRLRDGMACLNGVGAAVLLGYPGESDTGGLLRWLGLSKLLDSAGVPEVRRAVLRDARSEAVSAVLETGGAVVFYGGDSLAEEEQSELERLLDAYPRNRLIVFASATRHTSDAGLERAAAVYAVRKGVRIFCYDRVSMGVLRAHCPGCEIVLVPDPAFALGSVPRIGNAVDDILWLSRTDGRSRFQNGRQVRERYGGARQRASLRVNKFSAEALLSTYPRDGVRVTDWSELEDVDENCERSLTERAELRLNLACLTLGMGRTAITDRISGHVLCMLLGIPHVLLDDADGRLRSFVETWTAGSPLMRFADSVPEALDAARAWAAHVDAPVPAGGAGFDAALSFAREIGGGGLSESALRTLARACRSIDRSGVAGVLLSAGPPVGGASVVLAKAKNRERKLVVLDIDGESPGGPAPEGPSLRFELNRKIRIVETLAGFDVLPTVDNVELVYDAGRGNERIEGPVALACVDLRDIRMLRNFLARIVSRLSPGGLVLVAAGSHSRGEIDDILKHLPLEFSVHLLSNNLYRLVRKDLPFESDEFLRAAEAAKLIPSFSTVLDLHCGAMELERLLPRGCKYLPCDRLRLDERTAICDPERGIFPELAGASVVAALDMCETAADFPGLLAGLRAYRTPVLISYCPYESASLTFRQRELRGWTLHLSLEQWRAALRQAGFQFESEHAHSSDPVQVIALVS